MMRDMKKYKTIESVAHALEMSMEISGGETAHPFRYFEGFFERGYISPVWDKFVPHLKERFALEGVEKNKILYPLLAEELGFLASPSETKAPR